jgi:four helix bundle protein
MTNPDYRQSVAWQRAIDLSQQIYRLTRLYPKEELFGLTSQMRRASVSIASNIAEGQGRLTSGEFLHFLGLARGSSLELDTQLEIAAREAFGDQAAAIRAKELNHEVLRILNASIATLRSRRNKPTKTH